MNIEELRQLAAQGTKNLIASQEFKVFYDSFCATARVAAENGRYSINYPVPVSLSSLSSTDLRKAVADRLNISLEGYEGQRRIVVYHDSRRVLCFDWS
jgi:hypothetical protein